jgi:hypothetical protein
MPYYVFRIAAGQKPALVSTFDKFKEAMGVARQMRGEQSKESQDTIKMTFAKSEHEAKRLIGERRDPSSPLEEWEA